MKKLLYISFIFLTILACKKDDDITGITTTSPVTTDTTTTDTTTTDTTTTDTTSSIIGIWTSTNQELTAAMSVSIGGLPFPAFNNMTTSDTSWIEVFDADSLTPSAIDLQADGTVLIYNGNDVDSSIWEKDGNNLTVEDFDGNIRVYIIVSLAENNLTLSEAIDTVISDFGLDISTTSIMKYDFTR